MNPLLLGGCAAGVAFATGTVLRFLPRYRRAQLLRRASADYHACRGTEHLNLLRQGADRHEAAIHVLRHELPQIDARLLADERLETAEIWEGVVRYQVAEGLIHVQGIGPKLRDRLLEECYDGTLESLERVDDLAGVGAEKAQAVREWVKALRTQLPELFGDPFPGREKLAEHHQRTRQELSDRRSAIEAHLNELEPRLQEASIEIERLAQITVFDFVQAMQGNEAAAERVSAYAMGVYPEWDPAPEWFEGILVEPEAVCP